jgi:hypothetical protein
MTFLGGRGVDIRSCYAAQAGLVLSSFSLSLPSAGITGVDYHNQPDFLFLRVLFIPCAVQTA